jgi:hypothetical protein
VASSALKAALSSLLRRRLGRRLTTSPASAANVMAGSDMYTVRTDRSISSADLSPTRGCVNAAAAT